MSRTVLINCSPKRRLSASSFLMWLMGLMIRGEKECLRLRTPADRPAILEALKDAGQVVFITPLYVDSLPSHVLPFLKEMEAFCREHCLRLKVYAVANNGFIEGKQNEPLMRVMENFCQRAGQEWCGGIGIGGGVMLNVERIMITVLSGLTLLNLLLRALQGEDLLEPLQSFGISLGELLLLACGIIAFTIRLARHINRGTDAGKRYTRIMVPSFIFILFADIFFTILSIFKGGIFRGWLSRPEPAAWPSHQTDTKGKDGHAGSV